MPGTTVIHGVIADFEQHNGPWGPMMDLIVDTEDQGRVRVSEKKEKVQDQFKRAGLTDQSAIGTWVFLSKAPMREDPKKGFFNLRVDKDAMAGRLAPPPPPPKGPAPDFTAAPAFIEKEVARQDREGVAIPLSERETKIRQQAEDDCAWGWVTALKIMRPNIAMDQDGALDPMAYEAVQAMAVGLMIRLEHARRG